MDSHYFDEYENLERRHWWFVGRRRLITDVLDESLDASPASDAQLRWLDVGCGSGVLLDSYTRVSPGRKVGVEIDEGSIARARAKGLDARVIGTDWNFEDLGKFDLITLCDVLEHLEHEHPAVDALHDRLNPGGELVVTVPALPSLWGPHDVVNHHFRRYRRAGLRRLFDDGRWHVGRTTYFSSLLLPAIYVRRKVKNLASRFRADAEPSHDFAFGPSLLDAVLEQVFSAERHLVRRWPLPLGSSLLLTARRA